jgi:S1-C subfamily serine protease
VLFFHTGTHEDYHRSTDTPDKLELAGMARIAAVGAQVVERLASMAPPVFAVVPPPSRSRDSGARAFLGVQGDAETDGAHVVSVVPGGAADRAGLREGDVVIRLAGAALTSFDDLRAALRQRKVGERVDVVFVRNGEQRSVTATLDRAP